MPKPELSPEPTAEERREAEERLIVQLRELGVLPRERVPGAPSLDAIGLGARPTPWFWQPSLLFGRPDPIIRAGWSLPPVMRR